MDAKLLEDAHILLHPTRYRIVELLAKQPMHTDWISRALGVKRGLVAYHLLKLQERGFVKSNYGLLCCLSLSREERY